MSTKKKAGTSRRGSTLLPKDYPTISRFFSPTAKKRPRSEEDDDIATEVKETENHHEAAVAAALERNQGQDVIFVIDDSSIEQDDIHQTDQTTEIDGDQSVSDTRSNEQQEISQVSFSQNGASEEPQVEEEKAKNPFSEFAFAAASSASSLSSPQKQGNLTKWMQNTTTVVAGNQKVNPNLSSRWYDTKWMKMEDLPKIERDKIITKWHSLADPNASLEDRRFQILVAARLHARCQEPVVRSAMASLRNYFGGELSVQRVAQANPKDLAPVMNNLQYFNAKALHIVKAAQEIKSQFGGLVPESEHLLQQLTGVGPVIADLLAFVNGTELLQQRPLI